MAKDHSDIKKIEDRYGKLAYDLCFITAGNHIDAEGLYQSILKKWTQLFKLQQFEKYEQEWILHNICQNLLAYARKKHLLSHDKKQPAKDIPYRSDPQTNLKNFEAIFPKLPLFEKLVLCLNIKYDFSNEKLASVFSRRADSIELAKSQALRRLAHWVSLNSDDAAVETIKARIKELGSKRQKVESPSKSKNLTPKNTTWKTPWYVRYSLELVGAVSLILSIVLLTPKIKHLNEYKPLLEGAGEALTYFKKIDSMESDFDPKSILDQGQSQEIAGEEIEVFEEEAEATDDKPKSKKTDIRVGNSEVWRFYIKTESLSETRPRIVDTLAQLNLENSGKEVPGGIQFSFLVPKSKVLTLKDQFEKLVSDRSLASADTKSAFTWYKNKARGRQVIPQGQSRVIVWISQI